MRGVCFTEGPDVDQQPAKHSLLPLSLLFLSRSSQNRSSACVAPAGGMKKQKSIRMCYLFISPPPPPHPLISVTLWVVSISVSLSEARAVLMGSRLSLPSNKATAAQPPVHVCSALSRYSIMISHILSFPPLSFLSPSFHHHLSPHLQS